MFETIALFRCASRGLALAPDAVFSGPVPGLDRSPAAAERYALLMLISAASFLQLPAHVLRDNCARPDVDRLRKSLA